MIIFAMRLGGFSIPTKIRCNHSECICQCRGNLMPDCFGLGKAMQKKQCWTSAPNLTSYLNWPIIGLNGDSLLFKSRKCDCHHYFQKMIMVLLISICHILNLGKSNIALVFRIDKAEVIVYTWHTPFSFFHG